MKLYTSIGVILNLSLIIGQLNADKEFDLLTADNINISHVGFVGKSDSPQIFRENKRFRVKITDTDSHRNSDIRVSADGENHRELEGENDLLSFGISEEAIRSAVASAVDHWPEKPIYYRRDTPWGDLFQKFGFVPAQVNLVFDHINLKNFKEVDEAVDTRRCENRSNKTITCHSAMSYELTNTLSNTWSNSHAVKVGAEVEINIVANFLKAKMHFDYQYQWGSTETKSQSVKITSSGSGDVQLKPGEAVTFSLMSRRGIWKADVVYKAHLTDRILANYPNKHNGHYFWFFDLPSLMRFNNMNKCSKVGHEETTGHEKKRSCEEMEKIMRNYQETIEIIQTIEIGFFTNSSVVATDVFRF